MTDVTFRSPQETPQEQVPEMKGSASVPTESKAEIPYTDYEKENGKPFTVDYFGLGDTWQEDMGGFAKEVSTIEEFIDNQIGDGKIPNNKEAVKDALKRMEKVTNIDKNERALVKIETLAAYVDFLMKCDNIKFNLKRYGDN